MRKGNWLGIAVVMVLLATVSVVMMSAQGSADVQLREAMELETVKGDIGKAINQYRKLAEGKDRRVAAQALLRLASLLERRGNDEARSVYERIVNKFEDQPEAVAVALVQLSRPAASTARRARIVATEDEGAYVDGKAVSPDGRYISYQHITSNPTVFPVNLAIHDLMTGRDRVLTHDNDINVENGFRSVFSPDSRRIAYSYNDWSKNTNDGQLRIVNLYPNSNSAPVTIVQGGDISHIGPLSWSPDGKLLAVHLQRPTKDQSLAVVSVDDGMLRVLAATPDYMTNAVFSPDSRYVAIAQRTGSAPKRDILMYAVDGKTEPVPLVTSTEDKEVMAWAKDGTLLFTRGGLSTDLWAVLVANGKAQATHGKVQEGVAGSSLGLTSMGALYYRRRSGGRELYTATIDFAKEKVLTPRTLPLVSRGSTPSWSPDGQELVYYGGNEDLTVRSIDTGQARVLRVSGDTPRWSPDARWFVLSRRRSQEETQLLRVDAATGAETLLVSSVGGPNELIDRGLWSFNGAYIYFRKTVGSGPTSRRLVEHEISSGQQRELLRAGGIGPTALSPDGRYLGVSTDEGVMLVPTDGTAPRRLIRADTQSLMSVVMWSPDSRVVYGSRAAEPDVLTRIPLDGSAPQTVDFGIDMSQIVLPIAVDRDGKHIAYSINQGPQVKDLWVLEHFLPRPKP